MAVAIVVTLASLRPRGGGNPPFFAEGLSSFGRTAPQLRAESGWLRHRRSCLVDDGGRRLECPGVKSSFKPSRGSRMWWTSTENFRAEFGKIRAASERRRWEWRWKDNLITWWADTVRRILSRRTAVALVAASILVAAGLGLPSPALASSVAAATENASVLESGAALAATAAIAPPPLTPLQTLGTTKVLPTRAELAITFRLLFAALGGSAVGLERSTSDRPAGVRTMALVSLGAASFTLCSMYGFMAVCTHPAVKYDPSRMASNVASGVGFIGAGVITNNRKSSGVYDRQSSVNGLTTAAAIWVAASVGVACGVGLHYVATTAALSTIGILRFGRVKKIMRKTRVLRVADRKPEVSTKSPSAAGGTTDKAESMLVEDLRDEIRMRPPPADATVGADSVKKEAAKDIPLAKETTVSKAKENPPKDPLLAKYLHGIEDKSSASDLLKHLKRGEEMPLSEEEQQMMDLDGDGTEEQILVPSSLSSSRDSKKDNRQQRKTP